jgi:hypothetical protein
MATVTFNEKAWCFSVEGLRCYHPRQDDPIEFEHLGET